MITIINSPIATNNFIVARNKSILFFQMKSGILIKRGGGVLSAPQIGLFAFYTMYHHKYYGNKCANF